MAAMVLSGGQCATRGEARRAAWMAVLVILWSTAGCTEIGALATLMRPREIQKPEYIFPDNARIAVLIDPAPGTPVNPVFDRALFESLEGYFRKYESRARLLPLAEINQLRRMHEDFGSWSVQRIGREAGADHVLHLRVERLVLRDEPRHPVVHPRVEMVMKLIGVNQPADDARLWPNEPRGRLVQCERTPYQPFDNPEIDREVAKLGRDTAYFVMLPFFKVDLEEPRPIEP